MSDVNNITVMQLNIWLGHLLDPAVFFINNETPDILCAQEVLSSEHGWGLFGSYQTHQRLSELFPYQFFAPTFSFQALGETVEYGNAIYSKMPIKNQQIIFTSGAYASGQTILNSRSNIRNLQTCDVVLTHNTTITVANHHGYHDLDHTHDTESSESMRAVVLALQGLDGPLVFCGDLNLDRTYEAYSQLAALNLRNLTEESEAGTTLSSAHRFHKKLVTDYIFVSPGLTVNNFKISDAVVSDHKPLLVSIDV